MRRTAKTGKLAASVMVTVLTAALSGCGQTSNWLKGRVSSGTPDPQILGAPGLEAYITELRKIASGDPAAQAEIFADASAAAELTPSPSTHLRLGLILAIPGHPESNPKRAQSLLRDVLTQTILLTTGETSLAIIHLNAVERQIVGNAEARRLRAASSRGARTQEQAISQRLASVEAQNRRLRRELEDAQQKLKAITLIERSIREQDD